MSMEGMDLYDKISVHSKWFKMLRSYFFECIAMKVAIGMEKTATNPNGERTFYLTCLKRFLTEVNNLRQVKVTFNPGFLDSCYNVSLPDIDEVRSSQSEYPLSDSSDDAFAIWIKPTGSVRPPEEPWKDLLSEVTVIGNVLTLTDITDNW